MQGFLNNFFAKASANQYKDTHQKYIETMEEKRIKFESAKPNIQAAHEKWCQCFKKPAQTQTIKILNYSSFEQVLAAQNEDDLWNAFPRICDCWIGTNDLLEKPCFYILDTHQYIESRAQSFPDHFTTPDMAFSQFFRLMMTMNDIVSYTVVGNIFSTQHVSGGNIGHFIGASVNGIGFGEFVGGSPLKVENNLHDHRFILLSFHDYRDDKNGEISTLFFTIDSLEVLLSLIPQNFRS